VQIEDIFRILSVTPEGVTFLTDKDKNDDRDPFWLFRYEYELYNL